MKLFNDTPFDIRTRRTAFEPKTLFVSISIKGTFKLVPGGVCELLPREKQPKIAKATLYDDEHGNSRRTDSDLAPWKPRADCVFIGSAHAPLGRPVEGIEVGFGVGQMHKRLAVWGDRFWVREPDGGVRLEGPVPFTRMPIRNEFAHGGPTSDYNRHGIGFGQLPHEPGARLQAANIMPLGEGVVPWDRDEMPAGFGVLAPNTLPRRKLAGTHDAHWLYRRRPMPPQDFDPCFLNGTRTDQQVEGYLRGDEEIYLEHLHPAADVVRCRLPGIRVRCFLQRTWPRDGVETEEFQEVLTELDTCIVDTDDDLVTLLWRGTLGVKSRRLERIHHMMVVAEDVDRPLEREYYLEMMSAQIHARDIPQPPTELSDQQKEKIAAMNRKGIEDIVATLRQGKADEALVAEVARQPTVDDALKVMTEYVEEIRKTLPALPET